MNKFTQLLTLTILLSTFSFSSTSKEIDYATHKALTTFHAEAVGSKEYLEQVPGYLVFPSITEAGFFIGGKYGEGLLHVNNHNKVYYSINSASMGMQVGVQEYAMIIAFTSDAALNKFIQTNDEWDTDMDMYISVAKWNSEEERESVEIGNSMVAFVFNSKGLMGSFSMNSTKFKKIHP